jgi:hypothetical protein
MLLPYSTCGCSMNQYMKLGIFLARLEGGVIYAVGMIGLIYWAVLVLMSADISAIPPARRASANLLVAWRLGGDLGSAPTRPAAWPGA